MSAEWSPPDRGRWTIKDVARAAGVGVVTVSRALNGQTGVSATTRDKIRQIVEKADYRPNRHARFLKLRTNRAIAVLIKGLDNPFLQMILDQLEKRVRQRDMFLFVVKVAHAADEVEEAIRLIDEEAFRAVIFLGGSFARSGDSLARIRVPFVLSTVWDLSGAPDSSYSSVGVDDRVEAFGLVTYLIGLGHRRIALLGVEPSETSVGELRTQGYVRALESAGIPVDRSLMLWNQAEDPNPYTLENGYTLAKELFARRTDVTAVFAVADVMAIGALRAAREAGLDTPGDVSIVGFDGLPMGEYITPQLTSIRQPVRLIADLTCDALFDVLSGGSPRHERVKGELVVGASSGPPRARQP